MTKEGRILGVDYGKRRIGLAISDENQKLAFPKEIISNDENTFKILGEVLSKENISEIVVGESEDFYGKPNEISASIEVFISAFKKRFGLPVHKQKEFLTSVEARRSKIGKASRSPSQAHSKIKTINRSPADSVAAALILQRYLDKKNLLR